MRRAIIILSGLLLASCDQPSVTPAAPPTEAQAGRWMIVPAGTPNGNVWRLDTKTGALQWCYQNGDGPAQCQPANVPLQN